MKTKFKKLRDGQWSNSTPLDPFNRWWHKQKCCDCGLVHLFQFELTKTGRLRFRAWRDNDSRTTSRTSKTPKVQLRNRKKTAQPT